MPSRKRILVLGLLTMGCAGSSAAPQPFLQLKAAQVSPVTTPKSSPVAVSSPEGLLATCSDGNGPAPVALPERVTMGDFWAALGAQIDQLDTAPLAPSFEAFVAHHHADASPALRRDFTRLWAVFEATRDGGWWRLRWNVTDQEPSSIQIWKAWTRSPPIPSFSTPSAVAECDEISALFSVTARHLGVRGVGLFYPTWNHVIAGWAPVGIDQSERGGVVLIPTTQIFQGCAATFDQTSFQPPRHVYEFPRIDVKDSVELPAARAAFLLEQVRAYGEATPSLLALIRAKRARMLVSSLGDCDDYRRQLAHEVAQNPSCADRRALRHLATVELNRSDFSEADALAFLGAP
jgi:hypothetical protein